MPKYARLSYPMGELARLSPRPDKRAGNSAPIFWGVFKICERMGWVFSLTQLITEVL